MWCQDYRHNGEVLDTLKVFKARGAEAVFNLSASHGLGKRTTNAIGLCVKSYPIHRCLFFTSIRSAHRITEKTFWSLTVIALRIHVEARPRTASRPGLMGSSTKTDHTCSPKSQSQTDAIFNGILTGLRHLDHIRGAKNNVLVAASGGIDSKRRLICLLEQAFGPERVCAVNMPTRYNAQITQNKRAICVRPQSWTI